MMKSDASDPDVAVLNGMMLLGDGKTSDAFEALQKASKNNPDNAPLHIWTARAALQRLMWPVRKRTLPKLRG